MSNPQLTLDEIFENVGFRAKWEARAEARGEARGVALGKEEEAIAIAKKMLCSGFSLETVVSITELDPEKVRELHKED